MARMRIEKVPLAAENPTWKSGNREAKPEPEPPPLT